MVEVHGGGEMQNWRNAAVDPASARQGTGAGTVPVRVPVEFWWVQIKCSSAFMISLYFPIRGYSCPSHNYIYCYRLH